MVCCEILGGDCGVWDGVLVDCLGGRGEGRMVGWIGRRGC